MHGLHKELGLKGVFFALTLELVFLGFCAVFIGLGLSELKKGKSPVKNSLLVVSGFALAAISVYVTYLFIEG